MIWLAWRQFRVQALVGGIGLAAVAIYLFSLAREIRESYQEAVGCATCTMESARQSLQSDYTSMLQLAGFLVLLAPAIAGAFWGAPLVAREFETGTHRLVWNQSVTRTRWLGVKLAVVALAAVAITGALSALFTWAASPFNRVVGSRFDPVLFGTRNIAPVGYALFAVVAGVAIGLFARRSVMAMAITLAAFAALQILMPAVIRPHLLTPVTATVPFSATSTQGISVGTDGVHVDDYELPGAWVLTPAGLLVDRLGEPVTRESVHDCLQDPGGPEKAFTCLEEQGYGVRMTYHPAQAYWPIQWLEFAIYLALAGLFGGLAFWKIRR